MHWWNRIKKWALPFFISLLLLLVSSVVVLMLLGPVIGDVFCTIVDCLGDGIHIKLAGRELTGEYTVEVDFPSGKRVITCDSGGDSLSPPKATSPDTDYCEPGGAFFEQLDNKSHNDKPPEELVITVVHDGERFTQTFHPGYEIVYANGEGCDPMCYFTTIEFVFPK
jgi:hypothetical protein